MNDDWLEDKLKDEFGHFNLDLDIDEAWEELQAARRLQKGRKRRGLFIWWYGLGLLPFVGAALFFLQIKDAQSCEDVLAKKNSMAELEKVDHSTEVDAKSERTIDSSQLIFEIEKATKSDKKQSDKQTIEKYIPIARQIDKSIEKKVFENNVIAKNENTHSPLPFVSISEKYALSNIVNAGSFEEISSLDISPLNYEPTDLKLPVAKVSKRIKAPQNAIGVRIGLGIHLRQLSAINPEYTSFVSRRNKSETPLDNWSVNIFYRKRIAKRLFVEGGLGFLQATANFKDSYTKTTSNTIDDHIYVVNEFPDGTSEFVRDTATIIHIENIKASYYQRHRLMYFNLLTGGEKQVSRNIGVRYAAGAEYALWASSNGVSSSQNQGMGEYSDINQLGYKKDGILLGLARLEIAKSFSNQYEINLGLEGKATINNVLKGNSQKEKRYHLFSKIGLVKWF